MRALSAEGGASRNRLFIIARRPPQGGRQATEDEMSEEVPSSPQLGRGRAPARPSGKPPLTKPARATERSAERSEARRLRRRRRADQGILVGDRWVLFVFLFEVGSDFLV